MKNRQCCVHIPNMAPVNQQETVGVSNDLLGNRTACRYVTGRFLDGRFTEMAEVRRGTRPRRQHKMDKNALCLSVTWYHNNRTDRNVSLLCRATI